MPRMRVVALVVAAASVATPARGADTLELRPSYDLTADLAATAAAGGATLALLAAKNQLAPAACRWCTPPGFELDLARSVAWSDPGAAGTASDVLVAVLGAGALGATVLDGYRRGESETGFANALLVVEATSVAMLIDSGVKYAVGRARPYVVLGHSTAPTRDDNLSFFSGHTTFAFAVAASSSTLLLSQHAPGAEWMSAATFVAAGTIGYLRLAAEEHYLTDVLAGAAVGTVVGWAVPHFFHAPRESGGVQLQPAMGGVALAW